MRCKDGSEKRVYDDIDDVFPLNEKTSFFELAVSNFNSLFGQLLPNLLPNVNLKIGQELAPVGDYNRVMQKQYRAAYAAWSSNPCAEGADERLREEIEKTGKYAFVLSKLQMKVLDQLRPGVKRTADVAGEGQEPGPDEVLIGMFIDFTIHFAIPNVYFLDREFLKSMQLDTSKMDEELKSLKNLSH